MSNILLPTVNKIKDITDRFFKDIRSKSDSYQNAILKVNLLKGKYGNQQLNEHQQREIQKVSDVVKELASEIDSEAHVFSAQIETLASSINTSLLNVTQAKLFKEFNDLILIFNGVEPKNVEEIAREISLSINALVNQIQTDDNRTPRTFAKKPVASDEDLKKDQNAIDEASGILLYTKKCSDAFQNKIGTVSRSRVTSFMAVSNQKLELLSGIIPNLKHISQYLQSDNIEDDELSEMVTEVLEVLKKIDSLPMVSIPDYLSKFLINFSFGWIRNSVLSISEELLSNDHKGLLKAIYACLELANASLKSKISDANKISDQYLEKIITDNEDNLDILAANMQKFFSIHPALKQTMPKSLYDQIFSQLNSRPAISNKDQDKIWSDYKLWYDKFEQSLMDLIDFTKMYLGIKMLYPFTIGLRAVDPKGRDVDTQNYVHSMQDLLNEALDNGKKMPTRKKSLIADLYSFFPNDHRIALAYYRTCD